MLMIGRRVALGALALALALGIAPALDAAPLPGQTKREAEVNVLRTIARKWGQRHLPGIVDPRPRISCSTTPEALCHPRKGAWAQALHSLRLHRPAPHTQTASRALCELPNAAERRIHDSLARVQATLKRQHVPCGNRPAPSQPRLRLPSVLNLDLPLDRRDAPPPASRRACDYWPRRATRQLPVPVTSAVKFSTGRTGRARARRQSVGSTVQQPGGAALRHPRVLHRSAVACPDRAAGRPASIFLPMPPSPRRAR